MNQGFHTKVVGFRGCIVSAPCHSGPSAAHQEKERAVRGDWCHC